jgi:hypothetical protein
MADSMTALLDIGPCSLGDVDQHQQQSPRAFKTNF